MLLNIFFIKKPAGCSLTTSGWSENDQLFNAQGVCSTQINLPVSKPIDCANCT